MLPRNVAPTGSIEHCPRDAELGRKMESWKLVVMLLVVVAVSSCTEELWKKTNPKEYVRVDSSELTEQVLQSKGIAFERDPDGTLYMEKSDLRKLADYTLRAFGTPVTIALDAATAVVVCGALLSASTMPEEEYRYVPK